VLGCGGPGDQATLRAQLEAALQAMTLLANYSPRLAGLLATGHAERRLPVVLHLCAEHVDEVHRTLVARDIPVRTFATRLHIPREGAQVLPGIGFFAGAQEFRLLVFSESQFRQRLCVGAETEPSTRLPEAKVREWIARLPAA